MMPSIYIRVAYGNPIYYYKYTIKYARPKGALIYIHIYRCIVEIISQAVKSLVL